MGLAFAKNDKYGYLNGDVTNCGTGMRASIHVKFQKLANNIDELKKVAAEYGLAVRPQGGEAGAFIEGPQFVDISNKVRLGKGEADIVTSVHEGILKMLELDGAGEEKKEAAAPAEEKKEEEAAPAEEKKEEAAPAEEKKEEEAAPA